MASSLLFGGDEVGALVFDMGSETLRVGHASDDRPKVIIPSVVGMSKDGTADTSQLERHAKNGNCINANKKYYVDVTSLCLPREGVEVVGLMKDGMIIDFNLFEKLLDHVYTNCLNTESQNHPVLFTESHINSIRHMAKKEELTELMFEKYNVPAVYFCKSAVLAAFSFGCSSGIVVDCGASHTSAIPVQDGYVISRGIILSPLGGNFITLQCRKLLMESNIPVIPNYMIANKEIVKEKEIPIWSRKRTIPEVTNSWHGYMCKSVIQNFQHSVLEVLENPYHEKMSGLPSLHYEFPNGYNQHFGNERFKIPEALFNPGSVMGGALMGTSQLITTSMEMCNVDTRSALYNNIMVVGGNSFIKGYTERLSRDLAFHVPSSYKHKINMSNGPIERRYAAWLGGSIVSSTAHFKKMWFSRQDYNELGKGQVHLKCSQ